MRGNQKQIKVYLEKQEDLKAFFEGERVKAYTEQPEKYHTHIMVKKSEIVEHYFSSVKIKNLD